LAIALMASRPTQPCDADAPETVALKLYLMSRARGMVVETPAVRP
jgi:sulfur-oxidizing protein SoxA